MNKKELDFILQEGEGLKIEFKESLKNIDREMVAFANAEGGRIFLGISDDNHVKGIKVDNKLKSQIQDIANNCDPPVKVGINKFDNVIIISVDEGENKPYRCSSGFYMRLGPNSQKMKTGDIKNMVFAQGKTKFDDIPFKNFDFKDFDANSFNDYLKMSGIDTKIDKKTVLFNLGVTDNKNNINNAGVLFFSKAPKKYLINAYVTCVRFVGTKKVEVLDRIDITSNLVTQVEDAIKFIRRNTKTSYRIRDIKREELPEYPIEALREAIINAVMHRDYFEKGSNVQVDIFDDRVQISNVGALIPPLNKDNLGELAIRRNPLIADLFHRIKFVEKIGSGIARIKEVCKKHGQIEFNAETNGYFISVFKLTEPLNKPLTEPLTEPLNKIIKIIGSKDHVKKNSIIRYSGLSRATVTRHLSKLKSIGLIKFVGSDKTGYYILIKK